MALTKPFINNFPAFDATQGIDITMSVLGGDAITGYQFSLYSNDGNQSPFYTSPLTQVSNDMAGATIRSFPIRLTANIGNIVNKLAIGYIFNGENATNETKFSGWNVLY